MEFTKEELNALGLIVSDAKISGKDAPFIAALLEKIAAMLQSKDALDDLEIS
jgi:hypothetical protein